MRKHSPAKLIAIILGDIITVLAFSFTVSAQSGELLFKNGTTLSYEVSKGEANYNVNVTVASVNPTLVFGWTSADEPVRKGHVTVSANAIDKGRQLSAALKEGDDRSDVNIFWVSKAQITELKLGKSLYAKDGGEIQGIVTVGKETMEISVNGTTKSVDVLHARSAMSGNDDELWVLNNKNNPLILKSIISGQKLQLKQINL